MHAKFLGTDSGSNHRNSQEGQASFAAFLMFSNENLPNSGSGPSDFAGFFGGVGFAGIGCGGPGVGCGGITVGEAATDCGFMICETFFSSFI